MWLCAAYKALPLHCCSFPGTTAPSTVGSTRRAAKQQLYSRGERLRRLRGVHDVQMSVLRVFEELKR